MNKRNIILLAVIILVVVGYNKIGDLFPMDYYDTVVSAAEGYEIDPFMIMAVIKAESNFKIDATSHKSASGLMQITDDTAHWCAEKMGVQYSENFLFDADYNIKMGVFYVDYLMKRYNNDLTSAAAAYNAGMGNVDKWLENKDFSADGKTLNKTPFNETSVYINKVKFNYKIYELLYGGKKNG